MTQDTLIPASPQPPSELAKRFDFHIKEYESLRNEVMFHLNDIRTAERSAVIAPVAAYSWLATQHKNLPNSTMEMVAWWLPLVLVILLWRRCRSAARGLHRIAGYVVNIEEQVRLPNVAGWQCYLSELRRNQAKEIASTERVFWVTWSTVCFAVASAATASWLPWQLIVK